MRLAFPFIHRFYIGYHFPLLVQYQSAQWLSLLQSLQH